MKRNWIITWATGGTVAWGTGCWLTGCGDELPPVLVGTWVNKDISNIYNSTCPLYILTALNDLFIWGATSYIDEKYNQDYDKTVAWEPEWEAGRELVIKFLNIRKKNSHDE